LLSPISITSNDDIIDDGRTPRRLLKQVASLKLEVQESKMEADRIRRDYQLKVVQIEEDYGKEHHKLEMDLLKTQTQAARNEKEFENLQSIMSKQIEEFNEKISKLEKERPVVEEQIRQAKSQFLDEDELIVSDGRYSEIKRIDSKNQTLKHFIQCKLYEIVSKYRDEAETTKRENDVLSENLQRTVLQLEKIKREHDHLSRIHTEMDKEYKTQITILENKLNKVSGDLEDRIQEVEENRVKAQMFDTIKSRANEFESQSSQYQQKLEYLEATLLR
jgi:hypothetical protein